MDMTIKDEIEQLILRCIASDGLKACPKDLAFLEKYGLKNLFFFSVEYGMEGADTQSLDGRAKSQIRWNLYVTDFPLLRRMYEREGKGALMECLYLEERYFRKFLSITGQEDNRTYRLIRMESTGCLSELAAKVRVSERTISNYLEELRLMGAEIKFSRVRNTYYFDNRFVLYATFEARIEAEVLNDSEEHLVCNYNKSFKNN